MPQILNRQFILTGAGLKVVPELRNGEDRPSSCKVHQSVLQIGPTSEQTLKDERNPPPMSGSGTSRRRSVYA